MRIFQKLVFLGVVSLAAACSSTNHTATAPDDVYYSTGDPSPAPPPAVSHSTPASSDYSRPQHSQSGDNAGNSSAPYQQSPNEGNYSTSEQYRDSGGNYITNNYYNGDYYDYGYTSRLRRFYSPMPGYGYYDPYYSDPYFYGYGPSFGLSIGFGYGLGLGFGYGYSPFYNPFYPYCGFGFGYYSGFYGGYYSPYYAGYYHPYAYGYEGLGYNYGGHYGPRGSLSGNSPTVLSPPRGGMVAYPGGDRSQESLPQSVRGENISTTLPMNGVNLNSERTGQNNSISTGTPSGGVNSIPKNSTGANVSGAAEAPVNSQSENGIISQKNSSGGSKLPANSLSTGSSVRGGEVSPIPSPSEKNGNTSTSAQQNRSNGGTVRPNLSMQAPAQQGGQLATPISPERTGTGKHQPNIQSLPNNSGGTVRPNFEQPLRNGNQQGNQWNQSQGTPSMQPQNGNQSRSMDQQRGWNNQRSNRSYESPRQSPQSQPRMQPKQEPRQFSTPHEQRNQNAPAPPKVNPGGGGGNNNGGGGTRNSTGGGRRK